MFKKSAAILLALVLLLTSAVYASAADTDSATTIQLSDDGVTVDGQAASTSSTSAVYIGAPIVYYEAGHDATYGEGTAADAHDSSEAAKHTVVTITQPGTYRISGKLSYGQIAVDLGSDAKTDPTAKVTLILDGVDITSTVAPAVIFYNVYEAYSSTEDTKGTTDLTNAGAQVVLADGSVNYVNGSYVARIYKEGTTKKLHKYDGAFYSRMSMNIAGETLGTGELHITGAKEGLDSELHLTINSGNLYITAQDDGINTNEDGISVTTINGGYLHINAGLGAEGDGIDSNGYLTINGGTIVTMSNERSPDGGIDSDNIAINGGNVVALGTRNDATGTDSKQTFIELQFASTQAAGSVITLKDADGNTLLNHTAEKSFQSVTFSSSGLALNKEYRVYVNGVQQQYTGNAFGMGGGFGGFGGQGGPGGADGQGGTRPDNVGGTAPDGGFTPPQRADGGAMPEGMTPPDGAGGFNPQGQSGGATGGSTGGAGSTAFVITDNVHSFSGISASSGTLPFTDLSSTDSAYAAVKTLYDKGVLLGTSATSFSPDATVTRATAITALGRLLGVEQIESTLFQDVKQGSWYSGYVGWASDNAIVKGDGAGKFSPNANVTSAQMDLILTRYAALAGIEYKAGSGASHDLTRKELAVILAALV